MFQSLQTNSKFFCPPPANRRPAMDGGVACDKCLLVKSITTKDAAGSGRSPVPAVIADKLSITE
jgi:hypothetical protein